MIHQHDWRRSVDEDWCWWHCACGQTMHPSWTPESRAQFEAACDLMRLELTRPDEIVATVEAL